MAIPITHIMIVAAGGISLFSFIIYICAKSKKGYFEGGKKKHNY